MDPGPGKSSGLWLNHWGAGGAKSRLSVLVDNEVFYLNNPNCSCLLSWDGKTGLLTAKSKPNPTSQTEKLSLSSMLMRAGNSSGQWVSSPAPNKVTCLHCLDKLPSKFYRSKNTLRGVCNCVFLFLQFLSTRTKRVLS